MLEELVQDILADFTDEEGEPLAAAEYVHRAAERALPLLASDLDVPYLLGSASLRVGPKFRETIHPWEWRNPLRSGASPVGITR